MTAAEARTRVKYKFHIPQSVSTFDNDVDMAVTIAVDALAPYASLPATPDTSKTLASGVDILAWDFTLKSIDKIFHRVNSTDVWQLLTGWYNDNANIYFTEVVGPTNLKILPKAPYTLAGIESLPNKFQPAFIDFACSEFASFLAGSQAKFDNYIQATGAKATDSMINLSEFYENRANIRAREVGDPEGVL